MDLLNDSLQSIEPSAFETFLLASMDSPFIVGLNRGGNSSFGTPPAFSARHALGFKLDGPEYQDLRRRRYSSYYLTSRLKYTD